MIGLVRLALRRPYTSAIAALLILLMGTLSITRMIVDIFPVIDIPVVMVVWNYNGLTTEDMERRVVFITERAYSTTVNGIQRIESQSIPSIGILKVYFQPGTDIGGAIAQITAVNNSVLRGAPPGMQPPGVIQFNASNVPVVQMTLSSKTLTEQQIFDYSLNFIRIRLFTIPGLSTPGPFGGKSRQIIVDLDPSRLQAKGFAPVDVVNALQASNVIIPAGTARLGEREYNVQLNSSPTSVDRFNALPIGVFNGAPVTIGDVGQRQRQLRDPEQRRACQWQARGLSRHPQACRCLDPRGGRCGARCPAGDPGGRARRARAEAGLRPVGVRARRRGERDPRGDHLLDPGLVLILVFLGSWRNTVIVSTSIPLSIFAGIVGLFLTGNTINLMTLGGLALAIGLLVDNATVTIENIHRNQSLGKPLTVAILDGSSEVIQPLTVATLAICIVFFPVVLLFGVARFLFIPLAVTVVFCMLASYVLSFSVVPSFARFLLASEAQHHGPPRGFFAHVRSWLQSLPRRLRQDAGRRPAPPRVRAALRRRTAGRIARTGQRDRSRLLPQRRCRPDQAALPRAARHAAGADRRTGAAGRGQHPQDHSRRTRWTRSTTRSACHRRSTWRSCRATMSASMDAEILISLKPGHRPSIDYIRAIRARLPDEFPAASSISRPPISSPRC